ncbi:MAG: hypothetical protein NDJ90_10505 [Oligoflexia bacterium]|nr:hypothetical protein [Oligoflexia bacterium]
MTTTTEVSRVSIRVVEAAAGWDWFVQAFRLFRTQPWMWILLLFVQIGIQGALRAVPFIGPLASTVLAFVFQAGFLVACTEAIQGKPIRVELLFEGFKRNTSRLLGLGGVALFLGWLILMLMVAAFLLLSPLSFNELIRYIANPQALDPAVALSLLAPLLLAAVVAALLATPLLMALWFAGALVMLEGLDVSSAMRLSFSASLRNWLPLTVYGLAAIPIAIAAILPLGLGLLVAVPVFQISIFMAYREMCVRVPEVSSEPS